MHKEQTAQFIVTLYNQCIPIECVAYNLVSGRAGSEKEAVSEAWSRHGFPWVCFDLLYCFRDDRNMISDFERFWYSLRGVQIYFWRFCGFGKQFVRLHWNCSVGLRHISSFSICAVLFTEEGLEWVGGSSAKFYCSAQYVSKLKTRKRSSLFRWFPLHWCRWVPFLSCMMKYSKYRVCLLRVYQMYFSQLAQT